MWPTLLTLWRTLSAKAPRKGSPRRRPACRRLLLEVLEDRTVPTALSYSTFLNGIVYASAVDSAGNVYVTGQTGSNFQATPGAFQTSGSGAFVAKLNPTGTAVLYATYIGNATVNFASGTGIAVDGAGDAFVIGKNTNVPTTPNAIASSASGQVFVAELNPTGSDLVYSTYLPGAFGLLVTLGNSGAIAVDGSGNIYVAGSAEAGFPVTAGAFQTACFAPTGDTNAFFAKINPALSGSASLLYATYLGGGLDQASGIALDGAGNAYLTGLTFSTNFPTTSGAFQTTFGGRLNAFVAKFNPALSGAASLVYSTYLGGSGTDYESIGPAIDVAQTSGGIAVDSAGNAYVTGATGSTDFPTTPGAFQVQSGLPSSGGGLSPSDVFVTKLNATGTALVYSTYLGGGSTHSGGTSIALDSNGDAYLTGWTTSTAFPTQDPLQATNAGGSDAFVTVLNPSGSSLLFSSYLGGSNNDYGFGIALDSAGNAYVGGRTDSSTFPTTSGAYQTTAGSGFVFMITPVVSAGPSFAITGPTTLTAGTADSFTVTAQDAHGSTLTNYTGTVHFTSSDPQAVLPPDYTFTAADQGMHTFTVALRTAGDQTIAVADTASGSSSGDTTITVTPAAPDHFTISASTGVVAGAPFDLTVTVLDAFNNVVTGYIGTVTFTSSDQDPGVVLPADYTFTAADNGTHTFSGGATLYTTGDQTITATDTLDNTLTGTLTVTL
jgi:hypothetical protein